MSFSWEVTDYCVAIPAYEVIDFSTYTLDGYALYQSAGGMTSQFSRQIYYTSFYAQYIDYENRAMNGYIYDFDDNLLDSKPNSGMVVRTQLGKYTRDNAKILIFPELVNWQSPVVTVKITVPFQAFIQPNVSSSNPNIALYSYNYSYNEEGATHYYSLNLIGSPVPSSRFLSSIGIYFYGTKINSSGDVTIDTTKGFYRPLVYVIPYYTLEFYRNGYLFLKRQLYQNYIVTEDVSPYGVRLYPMMSEYYPVYSSLPAERRLFAIEWLLHYPESFWMEGTDELI